MSKRIYSARFRKFLEDRGGWEYDAEPAVTKEVGESASGLGAQLANALNPILDQLRAGCRPLPQEVQRGLDCAGKIGSGQSFRCDSVADRSPSVLAAITEQLGTLARGAAIASGTDLKKIAQATELVLGNLITSADLSKGEFARYAVDSRLQIGAVFAKTAGTLGGDLDEKYQMLLKAYNEWDGSCCVLKNCRHFVELEKSLHVCLALRKRNRGEVMAGQRRRG